MRRALTWLIFGLLSVPATHTLICAQGKESKPEDAPHYISPGPRGSVEIGDFYFKRKRYAGALSRYKEAVKSDPHYAPAYLGLGRVYERMGLKQKALENYQRYLDELPSKKQADDAKDVHRAIERLRRHLSNSPAKEAGNQ